MKVILVLVLILAAIGVYFSVIDSDKPAIELTEDAIQLPAAQDDAMEKRADSQHTKALDEKAIYTQTTGDSGKNSQSSSSTQMVSQNPRNTGVRDDIAGEYDPDAIAPEDESVQNVFDDAMQVSESDALAPEAGTEMMPDGDGNPMFAEPIAGAKAPESMDSESD